jgi:hypothetical protein
MCLSHAGRSNYHCPRCGVLMGSTRPLVGAESGAIETASSHFCQVSEATPPNALSQVNSRSEQTQLIYSSPAWKNAPPPSADYLCNS